MADSSILNCLFLFQGWASVPSEQEIRETLESATYSALGTETHLQSQLLPVFENLLIGLLIAYWICFREQQQSWRPHQCRVKPLTCHFIVCCNCIMECLHVISEISVKMRRKKHWAVSFLRNQCSFSYWINSMPFMKPKCTSEIWDSLVNIKTAVFLDMTSV